MAILVSVLGGLGLFIYGMNIMAEGLQKSAGDKLRSIIGKLTTNKYLGLLVGAVVTMLIQSSSATTVMTIGFINANIMDLNQAVGVIMGANIGTTITGQLIAFNLSDYAPIAIAIGVGIWVFSKESRTKNISEVIIGFGFLFFGLQTMSNSLAPLADSALFADVLTKLNNPILAMVAGFLLTTMVQSSSASIGILQVLTSSGLIPVETALPILYGDNIGTTTTSLISSIGANTTAKRAAMLHCLFNFVGTLIFIFILHKPILYIVSRMNPSNPMRQVANAHTIFNIINVIIQLPFSGLLVKAVRSLVPDKEEYSDNVVKYIDPRLLETPSIALEQMKLETLHMGELAHASLKDVKALICYGERDRLEDIQKREQQINQIDTIINKFGVDLSSESLSYEESRDINIYLDIVRNIERIGDHIDNISEYMDNESDYESINFSEYGEADTIDIFDKVIEILGLSLKSFENNDHELADKVRLLEKNIDDTEKEYKQNHLKRLDRGTCTVETGIVFIGTVSSLERIADYSYDISKYAISPELHMHREGALEVNSR